MWHKFKYVFSNFFLILYKHKLYKVSYAIIIRILKENLNHRNQISILLCIFNSFFNSVLHIRILNFVGMVERAVRRDHLYWYHRSIDWCIIPKCRRRPLCWNSWTARRRLGITGEFPSISATTPTCADVHRTWRSLSTIPTIPDDVCMKLRDGLSPGFVDADWNAP